MGAVLPFRDPSDYGAVLRTIRRLWNEGMVEFHAHAVLAMRRAHLTDQDVEHVVMTGSIIEHNKPRAEWRWKIQGGCLDGHTASCVVAIETHGAVLVITVIDEG